MQIEITVQFTTKPFIDETIVQQRIQTLIADIVSSVPSSLEGVTIVAATSSSMQFANLFSAAFRFQGIDSIVITGPEEPSSKWLVENQTSWMTASVILQDVSSTGQHLKSLQELCIEHLSIPIRTVVMLSKHQENESDWEPDWTGFCIPNEFVVGCGMDINGQLGALGSIKVLA